MLRLALFDLDDTLVDHAGAVRRGIRAHTASLGPAYARDPAEQGRLWYALEERHYPRYLDGELSYEGQRRVRAQEFAAAHGEILDEDRASAWFAAYLAQYVAAWSLHPDALPVLDALAAAGVRVGVITNGELDFQLGKIAGVGLTDRFEHVVASGEIGVTKPDPRIFAHACALFDVAPADALYVGDRLATDAVGAARAGLTGVWLDRPGTPGHGSGLTVQAQEAGVRRVESLTGIGRIAGV